MKPPKYPINTFKIQYNYEEKCFYMWNAKGDLVTTGAHGREMGRDAWDMGAEEVVYDYDLGIDEKIPMRPRHIYEKYKAGS